MSALEKVPAQSGVANPLTSGMGSRSLRNTALVLVARVASRLVALVTVGLMTGYLLAPDYGRFQLLITVSGLVTVVLDLGFNTLFTREAARRPAEISRYLGNLIPVRLLFAPVALLAFALALWPLDLAQFLLPGFALMILTSFSNLLRGALYAVQRLAFEAVAIVVESLILVALVLFGIKTRQGLPFFLWAYAASYGFSCAYFAIVLRVRGLARLELHFEPQLIRRWLWAGLPFALTLIITGIYFKIDQPILKAMRGFTEAGWYGAAYKPFEALLFVPLSMLNVVFPALSVHHREGTGQVAWAVNRFYKALLLLGWPATIGLFMLSDAFRVIYQYPEATPALRILSLGVVFMFISTAFTGALNAIDRQVLFTYAALGSMVVNVLCNLILIPTYGYLGASAATVLTEIALCLLGAVLVFRNLGRMPLFRLSWRVLLAGLVMAAALYPFQHRTGVTALLVVAGGALVYGLALVVLRALDEQEWALVKRALGRS